MPASYEQQGGLARSAEAAMTHDKDFKRKVREHARRTGRSYASVHRRFSRHRGEEIEMQKITKPEHGFTVAIPDGWAEFPPMLTNSPYEVARFARRDHANHLCLVFRSPGNDPRKPAEGARERLARSGYGNFALDDAALGARAGVRLTFDKPAAAGVWAVREYFVSVNNVVYCLGLGSSDPAGDAAIFDAMTAAFDIAA
jgi:hypothetical protein